MGFISANVGRLMGSTSTTLAGAQALLAGESQGLAFDFTDSSAYIIDTGTPANNYNSTGIVSSGSLVGPSGKLTYTSPSNKLTLQADGYYKYQAHNLCTYSEEIDNGAWGKNGTPTITANADGVAELWTPAASSTQHWIREPVYTAVAGVTYVFSVRVKPNGYTNLQLFTGSTEAGTTSYCNFVLSGAGSKGTEGATATGSISAVGDGYYDLQLQVTMTGGTATAYFYLCAISSSTAVRNETWTPDGASGYYVTRAHLYRYPANTDYIKTTTAAKYALPLEYSATDGSCLGLLVEEARTNLILQSNNQTTAWANSSTSDARNATNFQGVANNATTLTASAATAVHNIYTSAGVTISSGSTYSYSAIVEAGTHQYVGLVVGAGTETFFAATFDIGTANTAATETDVGTSSGTVTSTSQVSLGNGLYRITVVGSVALASVFPSIQFVEAATGNTYTNNGGNSFLAAGTETFIVHHVQLELGSFPTSPIITYGATATRAADNISIATTAFPVGTNAASYYAEFEIQSPYALSAATRVIMRMNGAGSYAWEDSAAFNTDEARSFMRDASAATQWTLLTNTSPVTVGSAHKMSLSCGLNDIELYINGDANGATQDTSATVTFGTTMYLGSNAGASSLNGLLRKFSWVPRAKTPSEQAAETA